MQTIVEYGIGNALSAALLAVVVFVLCGFVRNPAIRHGLWVVVLLRLIVPPLVPIPVSIGWWSTNESDETPSIAATTPVIQSVDSDTPDRTGYSQRPEPTIQAPMVPNGVESRDGHVQPMSPSTAELSNTGGMLMGDAEAMSISRSTKAEFWDAEPTTHSDATTAVAAEPAAYLPAIGREVVRGSVGSITAAVLVAIWVVGTVFLMGRACSRIRRFRFLIEQAPSADRAVQQEVNRLATEMGLRTAPRTVMVDARIWPSVWGGQFRSSSAYLIIPVGLWNVLDRGQRSAVLAHELAHLRRADGWVRWLELAASVVFWWHPLLRWMRSRLHEAEEQCCDLWVVSVLDARRAYATALVETAAFLGSTPGADVPACAAGPIRHLQRRVTMIMKATWPVRLTRLGLAAVLGVGCAGLAFGPAFAQPPGDRDPEKRDRPREGDRKDAPRDGDRRDAPREGDRKDAPRDGDRPRDGERKDRPRDGDRKDAPRDGDRKEPGKDRPRDGDRKEPGKDRPRDGERPPVGPRDGDRPGTGTREEIEQARAELQKALERVRDAEMRLARLEGRQPQFPPGRTTGSVGGPGGPGGRFPGGPGGPGSGPFDPSGAPSLPGNPDFRNLQQQIEELRRAMEQMRRELRGPGAGPGEPGRPGDGGRPVERPRDPQPRERQPENRPDRESPR